MWGVIIYSVFYILYGLQLDLVDAAVFILPEQPKPEKYAHKAGCYEPGLDDVIPYEKPFSPQDGKSCLQYICNRDNTISGYSCGAIGVPENCTRAPGNLTLPYPKCCDGITCPKPPVTEDPKEIPEVKDDSTDTDPPIGPPRPCPTCPYPPGNPIPEDESDQLPSDPTLLVIPPNAPRAPRCAYIVSLPADLRELPPYCPPVRDDLVDETANEPVEDPVVESADEPKDASVDPPEKVVDPVVDPVAVDEPASSHPVEPTDVTKDIPVVNPGVEPVIGPVADPVDEPVIEDQPAPLLPIEPEPEPVLYPYDPLPIIEPPKGPPTDPICVYPSDASADDMHATIALKRLPYCSPIRDDPEPVPSPPVSSNGPPCYPATGSSDSSTDSFLCSPPEVANPPVESLESESPDPPIYRGPLRYLPVEPPVTVES